MSHSCLIQNNQQLIDLHSMLSLTPAFIARVFMAIYLWFMASLAWLQGNPYLIWEEAAILFTDIVNFSEQTRQHHREAAQTALYGYLLGHYQPALGQAVSNHQGQVVKFLGDGMMAIFPTAEQSLQAAQDILQRLEQMTALLPPEVDCCFDTRLAIDNGRVLHVIEGPPWRQRHDFMGNPVNNASHLANTGPANVLLISPNTYFHLADRQSFSQLTTLSLTEAGYEQPAFYRQ